MQVIKDGRVIQSGKYDELLLENTNFDDLVAAHHEAIEAIDISDISYKNCKKYQALEGSILSSKNCVSVGGDMESLTKEVQEILASPQEPVKEKKKEKLSKLKQLVQEEERQRGQISLKVYLSYMAAAYKGLLFPLVILSQTLFQLLQIASSWWMAWASPQTKGDQPKTSNMVLVVVYVALAFGSSLFIFLRAILVATFGLAAGQKLFFKMLRNVFRAPMSFFDSTPAGQILYRVSFSWSLYAYINVLSCNYCLTLMF